jgi:hypothetical protein
MNRTLPLIAILWMLFVGCTRTAPKTPDIFIQESQNTVLLPEGMNHSVIKLFSSEKGPVAVTSEAVLRSENGEWKVEKSALPIKTAITDTHSDLWIVTAQGIERAGDDRRIPLPLGTERDSIVCLFWESERLLHLGTSRGLYTWSEGWTAITELAGLHVNDVITDAERVLWVATSDGLWQKIGQKWFNLDETLMAVGNDRHYFSLATRKDGNDVIFGAPRSVGVIAGNGEHEVWRGPDGLPYGPARAIRSFGDELWFATTKGAIRKDSSWHYFHGRRWLADDVVNDILEVRPGVVWLATNSGISEIKRSELTLSEKAALYADNIEKRHNRRGLINRSKLAVPGNLSTSYTENEDNDGLWTSCFLAAECFRYAVTRASDAKERAVRTFEALERLETITGIPGYPARSYALVGDSIVQSRSPHPKHWHLSPDGKWHWLDDTSSDEITGHLFTLSLFYELVADEGQKKRVVDLIDRIVTHIIDNDFHIIDPDGKPTRWGVWHPDSLNHAPNWRYEKNLNSLQLLSHLKTASHFTKNPKYEEVYTELVEKHGYAKNAVEAKIFGPYETSHSDDILNFFPYYGLIHYTKGDKNRNLYIKSLERSWKAVQNDRMPVWNVIASALLQKDCGLEIAAEELRQYPIDLIDWSMLNEHRWDIPADPLVDRSGKRQALYPIPTPEASVSRWNTNPKRFDSGAAGKTEESGTYFLFAYWMGRYYGFFP